MKTYLIIGQEPHEPKESFSVAVLARDERHAKKYIKWLHAVSTPVKAYPTNEQAQYTADKF